MNAKQTLLALTLGLGLWGTSLAETAVVIKEPQVRTIITDAGYSDPVLIEQDGDFWRARSLDDRSGEEITLFVTPEGKLVGAAEVVQARIATVGERQPASTPVTEAVAAKAVRDAGFHNVHDIDYLDGKGVWKVEADDVTGEDYELHVDPTNGQIVHIEDD